MEAGSSLCWILIIDLSPHFTNLWYYDGMSAVAYQLKDPLEPFVKRSEFIPSSILLWVDLNIVISLKHSMFSLQVVEDGYEFFAKRQLVTLFSAPNYCGEFDNAGAMMSVDETLMCSFQVSRDLRTVSKKRDSRITF